MKQKHWRVSVLSKTSEIIEDDTFYTTDTEAYLIFEVIDEGFTPDSATVTVYNIYGNATINVNVEVVDGLARYEIPEEAIAHSGGWRAQVVYTKDNEDYTTGVVEFEVSGHLLDNNKPKIFIIRNWNSFVKHSEGLIDDWEQLEKIRQANERQRELAEKKRHNEFKKNETSRQENEQGRESAESVRVANEEERISKDSERDSKIETLEEQFQNVIDETTDKDVISAPELIAARNGEANLKTRLDKDKLSLTAQLQQTEARVDLLNRGLGETFATFTELETAYPTGDTKDHIVGADGHRYYWNGVAWADGGTYQAVEVIDGAVTANKLNVVTPKWYDMLTLGTLTNPGSISSYDVNDKVVLQTTGSIGLVKLDLTSDDVSIVGKLDTDTGLYWGKVIVITDSVDTFLRWEGVTDVETVRDPFLSYDAGTKKFEIDISVLKQSYPTASRVYIAYTSQFNPLIYRKLRLSQFAWLQQIEEAEVKDGAISQPKIKIDEELVLPAIIPCVVGHEMNCYWENALLYGRINTIQKIDTEYSLTNSERFRDRFIWKPTGVNSTAMKVMLWKKSLKQIDESKVVSFKAVSATAGTGTKKALIIGDSKTAYGQIVRKLKTLFDTDTTMDIEYLGTRYDNNNTGDVTYKHEGRGGWSVSDYVRVASKDGLTNPFYNVSTFDFPNYMTAQAYTGVDYVIINLSTNDQGRLIADVVADLNTMIASIKAYSSAIKVLVCLTEGVYRNKMEWDIRNTWYIELKKLMIATYDKREAEKIYVCPLYLNIDLYEDYNLTSVPLSSEDTTKTRLMTADGIHQNQAGFNKNANTMYYTIKYIESLG